MTAVADPALVGRAETGRVVGLADWRDYIALLKPSVVSLVVFTGLCGLLVAPGHLHPILAFTAVLCIAVGAGAAGALNQWYEADLDRLMRRTADRPIPAGRLDRGAAFGFGMSLAIGSVLLMGLALNLLAALLLAASILFYVLVYTVWLKRRTPQNIVIGGAAGAFPPVIGWAAVTGEVSALPLLLFATIFLWTPPHFWSLALFVRSDYAKAGVPMLPVVAGAAATRRQIMGYTLLLTLVSLLPAGLGLAGSFYAAAALMLGLVFCGLALAVYRSRVTEAAAMRHERRLFAFSILYLFLLFGALVADALLADAGWLA